MWMICEYVSITVPFLLWPILSHIPPIYTSFKCQFLSPLWSIWTYSSNFQIRIEWLSEKISFFKFWTIKRGLLGVKTGLTPHIFGICFCQFFFRGFLQAPKDILKKIWDVLFFRNCISLPTIHKTRSLRLILGLVRPNHK